MSKSPNAVLELQEALERGFQEAYAICEGFPQLLHKRMEASATREIKTANVEETLRDVLNKLYRSMARSMFDVFCRLQPMGEKPINFYFWPGYASVLLNRRIYYTAEEVPGMDPRFRNVGVGLYGRELTSCEEYYHSTQSRYYHYAWKQPKSLENYNPGSVYYWFREQRPCISPNNLDMVASLTVTTSPDVPPEHLNSLDTERDPFLARYQFVRLLSGEGDQHPSSWGMTVADKLNGEMRRYVTRPDIRFPDSPKRSPMTEPREGVALSLLSLWLHAAFSKEPPLWMPELEMELEDRDLRPVLDQLRAAKNDEVAQRGWSSARRSRFVDWTTVSLHSMLSPAPLTDKESYKNSTYLRERALGSAVFLSSSLLGKEFISLVRPWVRSLYGMVRNAEMLIVSHNEMLKSTRHFAMIAGPWFAHEMNALLNKNTLLKAQIADCSASSVALRRMILNVAQSVSSLAYFATAAVVEGGSDSSSTLKEKFLSPLRRLRAQPGLVNVLIAVARTVYRDARCSQDAGSGGTIPALEENGPDVGDLLKLDRPRSHGRNLSNDLGVCFLLVNEIVINHVRHSESGSEAEFTISESGSGVSIRLEADVPAGDLGKSMTLEYLGQLLNAFSLGRVSTDWPAPKKRFRTVIEVIIAESESNTQSHSSSEVTESSMII